MATTTFRSALVTGASSGIGEQIARVLSTRGCAVTLVARRAERLAALADELRATAPVDWFAADLGTEDGVASVEHRLTERPVELLVNNAGVGTGGRFHELPVDAEVAAVLLNVVAPLRLTRAALPAMVAAGRGGILNVSSIAGNQPLNGFATYAASKAFVTSFTESVAFELRGTGVHVTVVKPGYTDTETNAGNVPDRSSLQGRLLWLDAADVATAAVEAVEKGRLHCVPGLTWKAADAVIQTLPRAVVRALSSRVRTN
jgi:short-subunit dehydrogenase